jgi:hypothetical protein
MDRNSTSLITGTLLISFLFSSGTSTSPGQGAPKPEEKKVVPPTPLPPKTSAPADSEEIKKKAGERYEELLAQIREEVCGSEEGSPNQCDSDFAIALVPDPVHTHLAPDFDRATEVIQEALQDDGYTYVRSVMPWDAASHPESDEVINRVNARIYEEKTEEYSGLMVFQAKKPYFVFVVGESPTGGINARQFRDAIQRILETAGWQNIPSLRILGPNFSGSLKSLGQLLKEQRSTYATASVHSGTITGEENIEHFVKFQKDQRLEAYLATFQESDRVLIERFLEYMTGTFYGDRGYCRKKIALLSEDETAYGSNDMRSGGNDNNPKPSPGCPDDPKDVGLKLYFPREISQLRTAYQKEISAGDNEAASAPRDTLRLSGDLVSGEDSVAEFSSRQRVLSQEGVMQGIVAELRRHQIQFVLVRASDPMDTLFVSQYLRRAYPEGRVVTIGADMLFRREAEDPQMHGLLSLSTYSVAPAANHGLKAVQKSHVERVFPSSNEVGTYNALRSLVMASVNSETPVDGDRFVLTAALDLIQYGWVPEETSLNECKPGDYNTPPVRLLALGRDNYWPVAILGPYPNEKSTGLPRADGQKWGPLEELELPASWRVVQLVAIALAAGFCLMLWFSSVFSPAQALAKFAPAAQDARSNDIFVSGLAVTVMILILLWPSTHRAKWGGPDVLLWFAAVCVFVVTILELVGRDKLASRARREERGLFAVSEEEAQGGAPNESMVPKNYILAAIFGVSMAFFALYSVKGPEPPEAGRAMLRRFATLRATQLASGLSFIMPIFFFLSAWLWWSDSVVAGHALLDERRPRLPKSMTHKDLGSLAKQIPKDLIRVLWPRSGDYGVRLILLAAIGWGIWYLVDWDHLSLESSFAQKMMVTCGALALAGLVGSTLRLWAIWTQVRRLQDTLDSQPLRRGFSQIGKVESFSWKPIWRLGACTQAEFTRINAREREALHRVTNTVPCLAKWDQELKEAWDCVISRAEKAREFKFRFSGWGDQRAKELYLVQQFGLFQKLVAKVASEALDYLKDRWVEEKEEDGERLVDDIAPQVRACERFVCLVYVHCVLVLLTRIRTLIVAIAGMYVLILIGTTQYPFEPKGAIQVLMVTLLIFIITVVGLVFAQIHRDTTMSNLTDTRPGELGIDFWVRMGTFAALPLLTLFTSQFPSVNRAIYSWIRPAIESLNR